MTRFRSLLGASLLFLLLVLLLLTRVCDSQFYEDFTPAPDYDSDYNATFEYSFYSNTSSDDLDRFSERYIDIEVNEEEEEEEEEDREEPQEEDPGGKQEEEETVTMTTTRGPNTGGGAFFHNAASLPVCSEVWMLFWTVMILILNSPQLQHTC